MEEHGVTRIIAGADANPNVGKVHWRPVKSIWIGSMTLVGLVFAPLTFSWQALGVFLVLSAITLCAGHSVGMHRRLIHNSFSCPLWLEYAMVYLGVLVGMSGPFGLMRTHDLRDWAQRQPHCHDYLCHRRGMAIDGFWQLHCDITLAHPPRHELEPRLANNRFYHWLERTWMLQQIPIGLALFALGGWSFVVWGVALRVAVCVTGHWLVGYFAHNHGPMNWRVEGAGVQGYDVPIAALLSMGEAWHNNHHAFPNSARIGLNPDQPDPGWWLLLVLERMGLVWDVKTPEHLPVRAQVRPHKSGNSGCPAFQLAFRLMRSAKKPARHGQHTRFARA